jgi:hypothetical protein
MNNRIMVEMMLAACVVMGVTASAQENGNGRHSRMFAVPAPGPVKVDGKLDDWDRSGELKTYVMAATSDQQFGKLAVMYDADALYLGGEVRKMLPMMNRHAPESNGDRAWDADSLQFRLSLDPELGYPLPRSPDSDQVVHLLLWRYSDRQEPCLQAVTGMQSKLLPGTEKFGVVPRGQYQAAYVMAPDGKGYTFEYRIPWKTLGARNTPKGGDLVAATYQFNFGRADGLSTLRDAGWAYDLKGSSGFAYQNAGCWGKLVFSKIGRLPPELADDALPQAAPLPCTFEYDLPESGEVSVALYDARNEIVRVIAAAVQQTEAAWRDYEARLTQVKKVTIVRGQQALATAPAAGKILTPGQSFKARLAYDAVNLYVRYEVTSPVALVNAAADPQTIFKGGNLLDLQLSTDPAADPKRSTPASGDVRVLITRRDGKPFAVIYRPKVKGFTGPRIVLTSPTGKEEFDAIEATGKIKLDYAPAAGGFTATATLPLAELGWVPQPGGKVRLDVGYLFGNDTGVKTTGRAYWTNVGFAAGVLNDIPNESRLVPNEWGEMEVE